MKVKQLLELKLKIMTGEVTSGDFICFAGHGIVSNKQSAVSLAVRAYDGSIDAAHMLHESLLSGYGKSFFQDDGRAIVEVWHDPSGPKLMGVDDQISRAWLIAIISALIEKA